MNIAIDRRQINPILERTGIAEHDEHNRRNSGSKVRSMVVHQDSLEDVPDINSNNQDVCF